MTYRRRDETWWDHHGPYVKAIVWMSAIPVVILAVMIIVNPAAGLAKLRLVGMCVGIYLALIVPAYFYYRDRAI